MDAETPKPAELSLPQAFLLLATNDKDGKPEVPVFALRTTVAGAILAELDLLGAIELQGKHIKATGTAPQTDFQHELELIRGKSRPHTPKQWVSMLEGRAEVQRVYEGMAAQGIVEHVGARHLGLFRTVRYPEKDHAPEAALMEKIQAALNGAPPEPAKPDAEAPDVAAPDAEAPDAEPASPMPRRPRRARCQARCRGARRRACQARYQARFHGARRQDHGADRTASGGRAVRQALPGSRQRPGK